MKRAIIPSTQFRLLVPKRWGLRTPLLVSIFISIITNSLIVMKSSFRDELKHIEQQQLINVPSRKWQDHSRKYIDQKEEKISICFITSQFSSSNDKTDHLFNVKKTCPLLNKSRYYHFFAFSNLADLKAPGWEIIVKDLRQYKRWITQSRWPKFLAFKEAKVQETCQVVFYIDGILSPKDDVELFQTEAMRIIHSKVQFAQRVHPYGGGAEAEFDRIRLKKKDLKTNINLSLRHLRNQSDYNPNCTLYENSIIGYATDSPKFIKVAKFFWDHYSKEQDSWRDQPYWCYSLDHFNIKPLQLTGNGTGTLFDQVNKRTAKGSHKYKSESIVSAASFYRSLDKEPTTQVRPCWLKEIKAEIDVSREPVELFSANNTLSKPVHNFLYCPDLHRRSMLPGTRTQLGVTISIPYFAQPALLLQQLHNFASYPITWQEQLTLIIVDNGSPSGLRASDYLNHAASNNDLLLYPYKNTYHFELKIAFIDAEINWNVEGSHNLAFYLTSTRLGLMLDIRMIIPVETMHEVLKWNTTRFMNDTKGDKSVAHKFTQIRSNGAIDYLQSCALVDVQDYWNSGGMDEDFAGNYGYGLSHHFWFQWEAGEGLIEKHSTTFLLEQHTDICDALWLHSEDKIFKCNNGRQMMTSLEKEGKNNRRLWRKKREGKIKWPNAYLRFNWTVLQV